MKIAIMQPYFFPYIGYFQLINAVDEFIIYDNIEYTKKGWINRNRILVNEKDSYITLALKKDSDFLVVRERYLAEIWPFERKKMINRISEAYKKAPHFQTTMLLIEKCLNYQDTNLFGFLFHSIKEVCSHINIQTPLVVSSQIEIDHQLKSEIKVISICQARKASLYINPIGGIELYKKENFLKNNIKLFFLKSKNIQYNQFNKKFVPWLSIIDVMMFNTPESIMNFLNNGYTLI